MGKAKTARNRIMSLAVSPTLLPPPVPPFDQDRPLFEIINGLHVELPPMSILANRVASRLMAHLGRFLFDKALGEALAHTLVRLPLTTHRDRRPDVAFVSAERIAAAPPQPGSDNAWDIVPELMAEVISPNDLAEEMMERLGDYWAAGTKLVWVVYPTLRQVHIHESPRQARILVAADELEGGTVLPGLRVPIAALFPKTP
jgi:Uma2 family endonuclease